MWSFRSLLLGRTVHKLRARIVSKKLYLTGFTARLKRTEAQKIVLDRVLYVCTSQLQKFQMRSTKEILTMM